MVVKKKPALSKKKDTSEVVKGVPENMISKPISSITEGQVRIGLAKGMTLNMGNYQSARIDAWMERVVPDNDHDINKSISDMSELLDEVVEQEQESLLEESK